MQANVTTMNNGVETGSDWGNYKAAWGLTKGGSATANQSIYSGMRILFMKGLDVDEAIYENNGKELSPSSVVNWRGGDLNSWWFPVMNYREKGARWYAESVYSYWVNSQFSKDKKYYVKQ
jgi:hypothetical protein